MSLLCVCRPPLPGRKGGPGSGEDGYQVPPSSPVNGDAASAAIAALNTGPVAATGQPGPSSRGSKPYIESGMGEGGPISACTAS
jgi:hypothetical protein